MDVWWLGFIAAIVYIGRGELCLHLLPMVRGGPLTAFHVDMSKLSTDRFARFITAFTMDSSYGMCPPAFTCCVVRIWWSHTRGTSRSRQAFSPVSCYTSCLFSKHHSPAINNDIRPINIPPRITAQQHQRPRKLPRMPHPPHRIPIIPTLPCPNQSITII